jgi:fumarate hydratase subunit beta
MILIRSRPDWYGVLGVRRLEMEDFPVTVINDIYGGDLYEEGKAKYQAKTA